MDEKKMEFEEIIQQKKDDGDQDNQWLDENVEKKMELAGNGESKESEDEADQDKRTRSANNDPYLVQIWNAITKMMEYKNLSYRDIQERSGIPYTMVYDGCKYRTNISIVALTKILNAFGITLDEITCMSEIQLEKEEKDAKAREVLNNLMLSTPLVEKNYFIYIITLLPYMNKKQLNALKSHIISYA